MAGTYDIKSIQEALTMCGANPGKVDGIVGPNTAAALSRELGEVSVRASGLKGYFAGGGGSAASDM